MTDFFTESSDDEKEVKEILSQAMDMAILEQIAAINNAGFKNSYLPSHLESRFQNLKSFQSSITKPASLTTQSFNLSHNSSQFKKSGCVNEIKNSDFIEGENEEKTEKSEKKLEECGKWSSQCLKKIPQTSTSLSKSSENGRFLPSKKNQRGNFSKKEKKSHSCYFLEGFSKIGCFLFSPSKVPRRKSNENRGFDSGIDDEFLSHDLTKFSVKNQQKMMKKAVKEEEKICREAEKIVKWAKHASAGMDVSDSVK